MKNIIWLASFPKSGNTWLRLLLANLKAGPNEAVDINSDFGISNGLLSRTSFDNITMIPSGLLTNDEIDELRPRVCEALAEECAFPSYVKVHDAYTLTSAGEPILGRNVAHAALYIVRDPRDVVVSLAHHNSTDIPTALAMLNSSAAALSSDNDRQSRQLRQKLTTWSGHVASWLDQRDFPVHLIRYEDLSADTFTTLRIALEFLGFDAADEDIKRAVHFASFSELQKQEARNGFRECLSTTSPFFRRGEIGGWRQDLSGAQVESIIAAHGETMRRLGYAA